MEVVQIRDGPSCCDPNVDVFGIFEEGDEACEHEFPTDGGTKLSTKSIKQASCQVSSVASYASTGAFEVVRSG